MACDVCLKPSDDLQPLVSTYQTRTIRVACPSCVKAINTELDRLRQQNAADVIAFMEARRGRRRFSLFAAVIDAMTLKIDDPHALLPTPKEPPDAR